MRKIAEIVYTQAKNQFRSKKQNVVKNELKKIAKEKNISFKEILDLYLN